MAEKRAEAADKRARDGQRAKEGGRETGADGIVVIQGTGMTDRGSLCPLHPLSYLVS